jgi:hypothetical protein
MRKPLTQREIEIVMAVDRDTGVLDLRVYAQHPKKRAQVVGSATLRLQDLREVLSLMTEPLPLTSRAGTTGCRLRADRRRKVPPPMSPPACAGCGGRTAGRHTLLLSAVQPRRPCFSR